jgi:4-aminobutyrate aminotransferase-like enzyme
MTREEIILANKVPVSRGLVLQGIDLAMEFPHILFANGPQAALAKKIASLTPGGKLTRSFFTNSGTEANDTAILTARCLTGSPEIVALRHACRGRSAMTRENGGSARRSQVLFTRTITVRSDSSRLRRGRCARCGRTDPPTTNGRIAAVIVEPIQGIGGFVTPPKEYFPIIETIVRSYGAIWIRDEVQTGWGRLPTSFAGAKGLANGSPIGLTLATPEVAGGLKSATLSTFGGNPVTATSAKAVIDGAHTGAQGQARADRRKP